MEKRLQKLATILGVALSLTMIVSPTVSGKSLYKANNNRYIIAIQKRNNRAQAKIRRNQQDVMINQHNIKWVNHKIATHRNKPRLIHHLVINRRHLIKANHKNKQQNYRLNHTINTNNHYLANPKTFSKKKIRKQIKHKNSKQKKVNHNLANTKREQKSANRSLKRLEKQIKQAKKELRKLLREVKGLGLSRLI